MSVVKEASEQLIRISNCINGLPQPSSSLFIRQINGVEFLGPWSVLSSCLGFRNYSSTRLRKATPPHTITDAKTCDFLGVSAVGLANVCASATHSKDLLLTLEEQPLQRCFVRSVCRFLIDPAASKSEHPLVKSLRSVLIDDRVLFFEVDILALFGIAKLEHSGRDVYASLSAAALPHRLLYDTIKGQQTAGMNSSKTRLWALSKEAARACFMAMLARSHDVSDPKTAPPFAVCLLESAAAIFTRVRMAEQFASARRDWAAKLCSITALQLSLLSPQDRADPVMTAPLQALADAVGCISRQRSAPLASSMVAEQRAGLLTPLSIINTTSPDYLSEYAEPVALSFLGAAMGTSTARDGGQCPNLTAMERAENKATNALVTVSDALLHSVNPKLHPPLISAITEEISTASRMLLVCLSLSLPVTRCCVWCVISCCVLCVCSAISALC